MYGSPGTAKEKSQQLLYVVSDICSRLLLDPVKEGGFERRG
jgi:hypothetical protein